MGPRGAALVATSCLLLAIVAAAPTAALPRPRSEPALDRLDATLEAALGESDRAVADRVDVARGRSALLVQWAINGQPDTTRLVAVASAEVRAILHAVDQGDVKYRRVILKGTHALPTEPGSGEAVVVRAMYFRSTTNAFDFDAFDPSPRRTILDLADELRLAAHLGGHGIPSEPAPAIDAARTT